MKGKVFVGWNLKNELALEIKAQLKKHGYNGIVGGKNEDVEYGVGATVIAQMKKCSSAIMLFSSRTIQDDCLTCEKSNKFEMLSGNMLYELGYLIGSLKLKRVLTVYLDNAYNLAPSDLKGGWDLRISTYKYENDKKTYRKISDVAREIVKFFLSEQKDTLTSNKMEMITDISALRATLLGHITSPVLYETEIATIVMLYCQASYMHDDMHNAEKVLRELHNSGIENKNCLLAISASFEYFNACRAFINNKNNNLHLPENMYRKILNSLLEYIEEAKELNDKDPFKSLFLMVAYDYVSFINMMAYKDCKKEELNEEILQFRESFALKSIEYSQMYRKFNPELNTQLCTLFESYTYRNLALFYKSIDNPKSNEYFEKSIASRKELYRYFRTRDLNKKVFEQINMEYHLGLIDNIFDVSEEIRIQRCKELKNYIDEVGERYNKEYYIKQISAILEQIVI